MIDRPVFSMEINGDVVEVNETETGSYVVNYYQFGKKVVSITKYRLDKAMELARAFIDADDGGLEQ